MFFGKQLDFVTVYEWRIRFTDAKSPFTLSIQGVLFLE